MDRKLIVVTACDSNPRYLECARMWIDSWLSRKIAGWSIEPRLYFIGNSIPESLKGHAEHVSLIGNFGLPTPFLAQNIRTVVARNLDADVVMTTDVDMMPLSQKVTSKALRYFDSQRDLFVVTRDVISQHFEYPICYSLASPRVWAEIYGRTQSDLEFCRNLYFSANGLSDVYDGTHGGPGWTTDQKTLYMLVQAWSSSKPRNLIRLQDSETGHRRLDRSWAIWPIHWLCLPLVALGTFTDYHVRLPASRNKLYNLALKKISKIRP